MDSKSKELIMNVMAGNPGAFTISALADSITE